MVLVFKLIAIALATGYFWGTWKFWQGFKRTNFEPSLGNRVYLSVLWPALLLTNKSYRRNFRKALKGK